MLTISRSQMQAFAIVSRKNFEIRVARHLRQHLTEECANYNDDKLLEVVNKGITKAAQLQIHKERNIVVFIDVMLWLAGQAESHAKKPLVHPILNDPLIVSEDERIEILLGYVLQETQQHKVDY